MRIHRAVPLLAIALLALPASAPAAQYANGTYNGAVHFTDRWRIRETFDLHAVFRHDHLVRLYGDGGALPYDPRKSTDQTCGDSTSYDSTDRNGDRTDSARIRGWVRSDGRFSYVLSDQIENVYLSGRFDSARHATARLRVTRFAATGTCDSGFLPLTLSR